MDDLASHSFDLVNRELSSTLETARREIEDYVDGHAGSDALLRAAGMLHLAAGALKIVEIHGAALLAEEMEHACRILTELDSEAAVEEGVEALTRAMVQLPAYLERLLGGGSDVAVVLLPLLNDLRRVRNKPLLSEGTLLLLNTGPLERFEQARARARTEGKDYGRELQAIAQKVRPAFQTSLLGWIRGDKAQQNLATLIKVSKVLEKAAKADSVKQLWSVLTGVLVALSAGGLEASVALKRLLGQADRQLKRLIDTGENAFAAEPPVELLNSLLYYVARAECDEPIIEALRAQFGLEDAIPDAAQIERAREDMAGPSVKLMHTVAQAIKEDLGTVKDVLDIFVRTGMEDVGDLKPQLDLLKKIGDTLGVLGLDQARNQIQSEGRELSAIIASNKIGDPAVLEKIAATLLDVEDALDRELVRAVMPDTPGTSEPEPDETTQYRHVMQAVMGECIVNLAKVKEAVIKLVEEAGNVRALDQVKPYLRGITAGLLMLNKTRAVKVVERIGDMITTRLAPSEKPLRPDHLERLADAIVSVEYYMETISHGRSDPWYMLDNAERCVELLERLPVVGAQKDAAPKVERTAAPAVPKPKPRRPPSVMEVDEDRSDPELVEIFIEEAKEELGNIKRFLPIWTENLDNTEALISVRRSFHTLKGSGRMVGAQLLGEFAWSIENLLNRLINQTLAPSSSMLDFVKEAAATIPSLIEQLEIGIAPRADIPLLMKRAEAFAEGDPDADSLTSESLRDDRDAASGGDGKPAAMDPVLSEIFVKEMREHLATIRAYLESMRSQSPPYTVREPLYRACHTLFGSAKMADSPVAIRLAGPLDRHLGAHFDASTGLGAAGLATLGRIADEIERMAAALQEGEAFELDESLLASLDSLSAGADPAPAEAPPPAAAPPAAPDPAPTADEDYEDDEDDEDEIGYDPEIAAIFAEEAAELLENAETALQNANRSERPQDALQDMQRVLHTLKGGARMAGVLAMGDLSHALESLLQAVSGGQRPYDDAARALTQRCLDQLQQMRDVIDSGRPVGRDRALVAALHALAVGEPAAVPAAPPARPYAAARAESGSVERARDEASREEPSVIESDDSVSAAMVAEDGIDLSDESMIVLAAVDFTSARPDPDAGVDDSFGSATIVDSPEALGSAEALTDDEAGESAGELADAELAGLAGGEGDSAEPLLAFEMLAEDEPPLEIEAPPEGSRAAEPQPAAPAPTSETPELASAPPRTPPAQPPKPKLERRAESRETARVDADLLDALLNGAGEISIFQSRLNQQVHSIEFHLGELGQTVTRLREQLRSLEAETEAQIIHRHQEEGDDVGDFDPLELDRYSTIQQLSRALAETSNDVASINELLHGLTSEADTLLTQQSRVTSELQDGLMHTRMVAFSRHTNRLARIVRQAALDTGKPTDLVVEGAESELDRQVLENLLPALEHLLRNAVVHGIEDKARRTEAGKPESGRVTLKLKREGSEVIVDISDDGGGLNFDAIRRKALEQGLIKEGQRPSDDEAIDFILRPGFSTAGELTQAAGRGVGMDVVDTEVKKLGGSMRIESVRGRGTRFLIRLPYTLAITHALIVNVGDETFALPLPTVEGITRVRREQLLELLTNDEPRLVHGDVGYRVQHLGSLVGAAPSQLPEEEGAVSLVLVRAGENSTALLTDSLEGSREIVVKTLGPHLTSVPGVSGATILGDGRIIIILDAGTLVRGQSERKRKSGAVARPVQTRPPSALVVDDSITMRRVTQRLLERRGVKVLTARDGLDAITVLQDNDVDIILLDIEMPRMDGYQFATHVRNDPKAKDVPIIMITSRSSEKHRARAIEIGVNDYLSKPYQEGHLIGAMQALLGRQL